MSKRKDTHVKVLEPEIVQMKASGKRKREIAEHFGLTIEQVKELLKRYRRRERKVAAGIMPRPKGRPRKVESPRNIEVEQAHEINRLQMGNKLLRDFLQYAGRKLRDNSFHVKAWKLLCAVCFLWGSS